MISTSTSRPQPVQQLSIGLIAKEWSWSFEPKKTETKSSRNVLDSAAEKAIYTVLPRTAGFSSYHDTRGGVVGAGRAVPKGTCECGEYADPGQYMHEVKSGTGDADRREIRINQRRIRRSVKISCYTSLYRRKKNLTDKIDDGA